MLRKINLHPIIMFCFLAGLMFATLQHNIIFDDPDTGWHIRAGDVIRTTSSIPLKDSWSWTAGTHEWRNIAWLPGIAMSTLNEMGGFTLLKKMTLFVFGLTAAMLGYIALRLNATAPALAIALFYTLGVMCSGMLARPQLLSLLFATVLYALLRFKTNRCIWLLVPVQWLWANCHGGYSVTYVVLALFIIEAFHTKNHARVKQLIALFVACLLVVLINPSGMGIFQVTSDVLSTPANSMINEWSATIPANNFYLLGWLLLLVCSGGMLNPAIPFADKLLVLFWLVMGLMSARITYFSAIFAFPYLVASLTVWSHEAAKLKSAPLMELDNPKLRRNALISSVMAIGLLFSNLPNHLWGNDQIAEIHRPDKEVDFITSHYPNLRFFTHFNYGGYIIYRTQGALKVFMDGRTESAYPRKAVEDYMLLQEMRTASADKQKNWHDIAKNYDIEGFLVPVRDINNPLLAAFQTQILGSLPEWKKVYAGDVAAVYVRTDLLKK